jgi:ketosteroid isomerase-like protein
MSQENVELVRRAYEAFNKGDIDGALGVLASDFEYTPSGAIPGATEVYRGAAGFRRFVDWLVEQFDDPQFEMNDVIEHDDQLVFRHTNRGRGKRSGAETSWDVWQVVTFRDGKAVRAHAFTTKEDALEAAGLSE